MVDLMQEVEFVKVGTDSRTGEKLFMAKNGDGKTYNETQLKEMYRKNSKEIEQKVEEKPKKKVKKDVVIEQADEVD